LGCLAVGLAGLDVNRPVGNAVLPVEGDCTFQNEAVGGASKRQGRSLAVGDFASNFLAVECGGFPEVGEQVA
ncbi:MAG: hypothetical protein WC198_03430, partial [Victivallaceae bacterium]